MRSRIQYGPEPRFPDFSMSSTDVRRFSYRRTGMKIYFAFIVTAWGAACMFLPLWGRPKGWISGELFMVFGFVAL